MGALDVSRFGLEAAQEPSAHLSEVYGALQTSRLGDAAVAARTVSMQDVVDPNCPWLSSEFRRLVDLGVPGQVAASYLVGWYAGSIAELVGLGLASTGAAFAVEPSSVRWHVHENGWIVDIDADFRVAVTAGHAWAVHDVIIEPTADDVSARAVSALIDTTRPIVDACRSLTRIGAVGLWNEVADALGMALAYQTTIATDDECVGMLAAAVNRPGTPWRSTPGLWFIDHGTLGRLHVAQKGGCCLAYKVPGDDAPNEQHDSPDATGDEPDDPSEAYHRSYRERFPDEPQGQRYCSTCSFRTAGDCAARQVFWHEHHPHET